MGHVEEAGGGDCRVKYIMMKNNNIKKKYRSGFHKDKILQSIESFEFSNHIV